MAGMNSAALNTWFKANAATQLDTFYKTITVTATVWTQGTGSGVSETTTNPRSETWLLPYDPGVFDLDLSSNIGAGKIANADDVAASITAAIRSTVDEIENTIGNFAWDARVCHSSCHSNCHSSRGRR